MSVAASGTRHLHAVWDGVRYIGDTTTVSINSSDVPLVCPRDHLLQCVDGAQPGMVGGWHFNLHNDHRNTAFPQ